MRIRFSRSFIKAQVLCLLCEGEFGGLGVDERKLGYA